MNPEISYLMDEESMEAKVRWFRSLSEDERLDVLFEMIDLMMTINPNIGEYEHAGSASQRVLIIGETSG